MFSVCPQPARHSKLEKADILEMTVRHLQATQRRSLAAAAAADPAVLPRFREGFTECAAEATNFLTRSANLPGPARARLRQHLSACISALHQPTTPAIPHEFNGNIHVGGVPLIPSRLPTGELALVLPANSQLPFTPTNSDFMLNKDHVSAFQAVRNASNRPPSPTSSISSCDSINSEPATPPHRNLSAAFPTPPSHTSYTDSSPETQKQTVSSTTISPESKIGETKIIRTDTGRQVQTIWRQAQVSPYKQQWTPPSVNSSTENYRVLDRTSPKIALDYSLTPNAAKKRAYPTENTGGLLAIAHRAGSPAKVAKIACAQVSSSQNLEDVESRQGNRHERHQPGSSTAAGASGDMWRPW